MKQSWHVQRMIVYRDPIAIYFEHTLTKRTEIQSQAVLFTKNETKGTSTPLTETDFHFKTTFLRAAKEFLRLNPLVISKNANNA